jgi:GNAT superfamily N-acetyltransferase
MLSASVFPHVVRAAVPADASALAPLCAAHAAYERLPYNEVGHVQRLRVALSSGPLHIWLLERDGITVGYASVTLDFATLSGQRFAHLDCLYLAPFARGQGGGQALMRAVQAFATEQGCTELQWQTPDWNHDAMRFYARLGARGSAKQRYTLNLATEYVFEECSRSGFQALLFQ